MSTFKPVLAAWHPKHAAVGTKAREARSKSREVGVEKMPDDRGQGDRLAGKAVDKKNHQAGKLRGGFSKMPKNVGSSSKNIGAGQGKDKDDDDPGGVGSSSKKDGATKSDRGKWKKHLIEYYDRRRNEFAFERQALTEQVDSARVGAARLHGVEWEESMRRTEIKRLKEAAERTEMELVIDNRVVADLTDKNEEWRLDLELREKNLNTFLQHVQLRVEDVHFKPNEKPYKTITYEPPLGDSRSHNIHQRRYTSHPKLDLPSSIETITGTRKSIATADAAAGGAPKKSGKKGKGTTKEAKDTRTTTDGGELLSTASTLAHKDCSAPHAQVTYLPLDREDAIQDREGTITESLAKYDELTEKALAELDQMSETSKAFFESFKATLGIGDKLDEEKAEIRKKKNAATENYLKQRYDLQALKNRYEKESEELRMINGALSQKLRTVIDKAEAAREMKLMDHDRALRQKTFLFRKGAEIANRTTEYTTVQLEQSRKVADVHLHNLQAEIKRVRVKCDTLRNTKHLEILDAEREVGVMRQRMKLLQEVVEHVNTMRGRRLEELWSIVSACSDDVFDLEEKIKSLRRKK